jgi:hypothetical protein
VRCSYTSAILAPIALALVSSATAVRAGESGDATEPAGHLGVLFTPSGADLSAGVAGRLA